MAVTCGVPGGAMRMRFVLALITVISAHLLSGCVAGVPEVRAADENPAATLIGTWILVSFESHGAGGEIRYPFGPAATGRLMYDAAGNMSAHLMVPERPLFASGDLTRGTDAEVRAAVAGYIAYFGTYTLDASRGIVTHHVHGSLFPNWIGVDQVRQFRVEADRLTIATPPVRIGGVESTTVLIWERDRSHASVSLH
jgi:hypothetical protein